MNENNALIHPGYVTLKLAGKKTGEKLRIIREALNSVYPDEYTWRKVADNCEGITYHGLRKLEKAEGEPRKSTLRVLADFYNIPMSLLNEQGLKLNQTFFLGKKEDMKMKDSENATWDELPSSAESLANINDRLAISHEDYDKLDFTEDGLIMTDDICIDIRLRVYQRDKNIAITENLIQDKIPFSDDDIDTLSEFIRQQVKVLSAYYLKLKKQNRDQL